MIDSTFHLGRKYQTYSLGFNFFITEFICSSRAADDTGLPYVYAKMELQSAFVATDIKPKAKNDIVFKEGDRVVVSAEILFPGHIFDSGASDQHRVISNKMNFGDIRWGRAEKFGILTHDVFLDIRMTLPKEMLNYILHCSNDNRFNAYMSYWLYEEEKEDGTPVHKIIIDDFRLEERQTHYYDWHTMRQGKSTTGSFSLFLKLWHFVKRYL